MDLQAERGVDARGVPDAGTLAAAWRRDPRTLARRIAAAPAAWREAHGLRPCHRPPMEPAAPGHAAAVPAC